MFYKNETYNLSATVTPSDAIDKSVTWSSSAPDIADVDANGKVTAKSAGEAIITVTTADEGYTGLGTVTVNVPNTKNILDITNSDTITNYKKKDYVNGCRIGIIMYGFNNKLALNSVFTLKSKIIEIKEIKKDETVGYDGKYKANKDEYIGIVPIGYADGIIRKNTGRFVYINNNKYKIVGNICMDMLLVLIDKTVKVNDTVEIIKDNQHINEIAEHLETINYEVMCDVSSRVDRKYIEE